MSSMNKNGNVEGGNEKSPIYDFFKSNIIIYMMILEMSNGKLSDEIDENIPFKLNVS